MSNTSSTRNPIADLLIRNRAALTPAITADAQAIATTGSSPAAAAAAQQAQALANARAQGAATQSSGGTGAVTSLLQSMPVDAPGSVAATLQAAVAQGAAEQQAADAAAQAQQVAQLAAAAMGNTSMQGMPPGSPGTPGASGMGSIIPYTPPPSGLPWWAWGGFGLVAFGGIAAVQAAKKKKLGKKVPDLGK